MRPAKRLLPLTPAQRERAASAYPLAIRLAGRRFRQCQGRVPFDELLSAAHYGLIYAVARHHRHRDVPFGSFVAMTIKGRVHQAMVRALRRRKARVLFEPDGAVRPDPLTTLAIRDEVNRLRAAMPAAEFEALRLRYAEELSVGEVARALRMPHHHAERLLARARLAAREAMA